MEKLEERAWKSRTSNLSCFATLVILNVSILYARLNKENDMMRKYIMKIKKYLIFQIALNASVILMLSLLPVIHRNLFDRIAQKSDLNIEVYVLQYVLCLTIITLLMYLESFMTNKGDIEFIRILKKYLFKSITSFSNKKFTKKTVPGYISLFNNDLRTIQEDYLSGLMSIIKAVNMIIIYSLTIILFFDWRIAVLLSVISVMNITIFPRFTSKALSNHKYEELSITESSTSKFTDLLQGFKLFNNKTKKNLEFEHYKKIKDLADIKYRYGRTRSIAIVVNGGSTYLINLTSILLAAYLVIENKITLGAAVASLGYIFSYIYPMQMLMSAINGLNSSKNVRKKIENLLDGVQSYPTSKIIKEFNSSMEIKKMKISFDEFVVKDFSFKFEKGKKYALIGSTGCGKSTILKSLAGINEIEAGIISLDGLDISTIDTSDVLAYLDQNEHIFSDDYRNNVTVYNSYSTMLIDKIKCAIDKRTYDAISKSKNCTELSGGEKKIVSILRKLVQDSSILLLDEPFTGVDKELTKTLLNELLRYSDKTIVMITHNIKEELQNFDEILLIQDGKVIRNGDYCMIINTPEYNDLVNTEIVNVTTII